MASVEPLFGAGSTSREWHRMLYTSRLPIASTVTFGSKLGPASPREQHRKQHPSSNERGSIPAAISAAAPQH